MPRYFQCLFFRSYSTYRTVYIAQGSGTLITMHPILVVATDWNQADFFCCLLAAAECSPSSRLVQGSCRNMGSKAGQLYSVIKHFDLNKSSCLSALPFQSICLLPQQLHGSSSDPVTLTLSENVAHSLFIILSCRCIPVDIQGGVCLLGLNCLRFVALPIT